MMADSVSRQMSDARVVLHSSSKSRWTAQNGTIGVAQMLNLVGQKGRELVAVVPSGSGILEWIFKFVAQVPQEIFG